MRNRIIWMMGGSGSGKSTAALAFAECGVEVADADGISRDILKPGKPAYEETLESFGTGILNADKSINRRALGDIVFASEKKLDILNKITHKYIKKELEKRAENAKGDIVFDAALPPADFIKCDRIILICATLETRISRIVKRDEISLESAENRIKSQLSDDEYRKIADVVFENDGSMEELKAKIKKWCVDEKIN